MYPGHIIIRGCSARRSVYQWSVYRLRNSFAGCMHCDMRYLLLSPTAGVVYAKRFLQKHWHDVIQRYHGERRIHGVPTIQCWFPLSESSNVTSYKALLWTSGHPKHQLQESLDLMETCAHNNKLPSLTVKHLSMVRTNSIWQDNMSGLVQPKKGEKFPIAIYSHGLWGWRQIHHSACENLASEGFVVFACDHTPDSMCSRLCAGASQCFAFPTPPGLEPDVERKFFQGGMERRVAQLKKIISLVHSSEFLEQHQGLDSKLDFESIHLWGHSYGGGTVVSLCCQPDAPSSLQSAVMLDGWIYPVPDEYRRRGSQHAAMLHLSAELWPFGKYQFPFRADVVKRSKPSKGAPAPLDLVLRGSDHQNFVDIYMIASKPLLVRPSMLGAALDPHEVIPALDELLPAYFRGVMAARRQSGGVQRRAPDQEETTSATAPDDLSVHLTADGGVAPEVTALLDLCGTGLSPAAAAFVRNHVAPVSDLAPERVDFAAYNRVMAKFKE